MTDYLALVKENLPLERPYGDLPKYQEDRAQTEEAIREAAAFLQAGMVVLLQAVHTEYRFQAEAEDPRPEPDDFEDEEEYEDAECEWEERWQNDNMQDIVPEEVLIRYEVHAFPTREEAEATIKDDAKMLLLVNNNSTTMDYHEEEEDDYYSAFDYDYLNPRGWHSYLRLLTPEADAPREVSKYREVLEAEAPTQRFHKCFTFERVPLEQALVQAEAYLSLGRIVVVDADHMEWWGEKQEVPATDDVLFTRASRTQKAREGTPTVVAISYHAYGFEKESDLDMLYRTHPLEEEGYYYAYTQDDSLPRTWRNVARIFRP